jgi:hypothetical protein
MPGIAWDGSQWEEGDGQLNQWSVAESVSEETARETRLMARGAWGHIWGMNQGTTGDNSGS